jgi:hypothetical protein
VGITGIVGNADSPKKLDYPSFILRGFDWGKNSSDPAGGAARAAFSRALIAPIYHDDDIC